MFGSDNVIKMWSRHDFSISIMSTSRSLSFFVPAAVVTSIPSAESSKDFTETATKSIAPSASASVSVDEMLDSTVCSAQEMLRLRFSAIVRMKALVSLTILEVIVDESLEPSIPTGCAAPIFVPGAIAATCAARVINTPAEPALEPPGAT
jgi:hypothetical protein